MIEILRSIDVRLFYFLNKDIANPVFDKFFPFITDIHSWILVYVIFLVILFIKGGRLGRLAFWGILIVILVSDQFSSNFLKHAIQRIRPCNALENVRLLVPCLSSYSFPSSHAVNNFAAAAFFSRLYPRYKITLYSIASVVALSRPIVGVHYPSDILAGALIGWVIGYLFAILLLKIYERFFNEDESGTTEKT